jgi:hypothetical protein
MVASEGTATEDEFFISAQTLAWILIASVGAVAIAIALGVAYWRLSGDARPLVVADAVALLLLLVIGSGLPEELALAAIVSVVVALAVVARSLRGIGPDGSTGRPC